MKISGKKILITGGSGFIGVNLNSKLKELGATTETFDISAGNDITNKTQVENFIKKKFDYVYHLAGFSGNKANQEPVKSFEVNTLSTYFLIDNILKYSPKTKLIVSSSRQEYGKPKYLPVDENHPTNPLSVYGTSKLCATHLAMLYNKIHNLDTTVFRTSNVYGPHPGGKFSGYNVINHFIDLSRANKTISIFGKGDQKRDYIYIDDLLEAFISVLSPKSSGQIYNLGYGREITILNMAKLIIKVAGRGNIELLDWPQEYKNIETGDYTTNISKIRRDLGFRPRVGFEEGIRKTIKLEIIRQRRGN